VTVGRALSEDENDLIAWLLRRPFPGVETLRAQIPLTRGLGSLQPASGSLNLSVAIEAVRAPVPDGPVPGQVWAYGAQGEATGAVVLWVTDGVLSAIEYGWVTDQAPTSLPTAGQLRDLEEHRD
jgi:hypothetical protein